MHDVEDLNPMAEPVETISELVAGGHVEGTILVGKPETRSFDQCDRDLSSFFGQFNGQKIGVPRKGSIHDVILRYYIQSLNLTESVEILNYDSAEIIAYDIFQGKLAGGVGTPALFCFASTFAQVKLLCPPNLMWKNNPSYGIVMHQNLLDNHPEIVLKFLQYHKDASQLLRDDPKTAAQHIANNFPIIDVNYAKKVISLSPKYCSSLSAEYIEESLKFNQVMKQLGYFSKDLMRADLFEEGFSATVHPESHHY